MGPDARGKLCSKDYNILFLLTFTRSMMRETHDIGRFRAKSLLTVLQFQVLLVANEAGTPQSYLQRTEDEVREPGTTCLFRDHPEPGLKVCPASRQ